MGSPTHFTSRNSSLALGVLCAGFVLAGSAASAQRRVVVMPVPVQAPAVRIAPATPVRSIQAPHVMTPAPGHGVTHMNRPREQARPVSRIEPDRRVNRNFVCANGAGIALQPVTPGFGFNYEHLNAVNGNLALKAAIDPATQVQLREAARLNCGTVGTGGYLLGGFGGYAAPEETDQAETESAPATQPQVIVVQVPAAASGTSQTPARATAAPVEDTPLPDEALFVLVLRDGSQLEATAFTRTSDTIVYITADGLRRTIQRSELDTDATIRVNGERGTQLQLSL
jgi:hypothetical protein